MTAEVYEEMCRSYDIGVAEFLDLSYVKPNILGQLADVAGPVADPLSRSLACRHPSPFGVQPPRISISVPASSSGLTSTSRALEPSLGPTMSRVSIRSISRPALANPTRSLRCSIDVEPN